MFAPLKRFLLFFANAQKLADAIKDLPLVEAGNEIKFLRPVKAIQVISLLEDQNKQQEICKWLSYQGVGRMFASAPAKKATAIFNKLSGKLQRGLLQNMNPARAARFLDTFSPHDRNLFLIDMDPEVAGRIFSTWPLKKQRRILSTLDQRNQLTLVSHLEIPFILAITESWSQIKMTNLLRRLNSKKFVKIFGTLDADAQVEVLNVMKPKKVAEVVELLDLDESLAIIDKLFLPQIIAILNSITEYKSVGIFQRFAPEKQLTILADLSVKNLLYILRNNDLKQQLYYLQHLNNLKVKALFDELSVAELKALFNSLPAEFFVKFSALMENNKQAEVLQDISPEQIAKIIEKLDAESQAGFLGIWDFEKQMTVVEKMSNPASSKLIMSFELPTQIEFVKALPKQKAANVLANWTIKYLLPFFESFDPKPALADILMQLPPDRRDEIMGQIEDPALKEKVEIYF